MNTPTITVTVYGPNPTTITTTPAHADLTEALSAHARTWAVEESTGLVWQHNPKAHLTRLDVLPAPGSTPTQVRNEAHQAAAQVRVTGDGRLWRQSAWPAVIITPDGQLRASLSHRPPLVGVNEAALPLHAYKQAEQVATRLRGHPTRINPAHRPKVHRPALMPPAPQVDVEALRERINLVGAIQAAVGTPGSPMTRQTLHETLQAARRALQATSEEQP